VKQLGQAIKAAREGRGVTQRSLADALGLTSAQFVSNIERGIAPLPAHYIPILCRLLGMSEKMLIDLATEAYRRRMRAAIRSAKERGV